MKNSVLVLPLAVLALAACEKLYISQYYRSEVFPPGNSGGGPAGPEMDTTVLLSAVLVPANYDWRRDSSYGCPSAELLLLENGVKKISIKTGAKTEVSPDPATHHLLGGHLYTEYCGPAETVVKKDGKQLFRYQGREVLLGLLPMGNNLYTLGKDRDGDGFSFRRNGELLLKQASGSVYGDFTNSAFGDNGALYEDEGRCCFCFSMGDDCFKVVDGVMEREALPGRASQVLCMRVVRSEVYYSMAIGSFASVGGHGNQYVLPSAYTWKNIDLFLNEGELWLIACGERNGEWFTICGPPGGLNATPYVFKGRNNFMYKQPEGFCAVDISGGDVSATDAAGMVNYSRDSTFFFSRSCAAVAGESFYMALTPRERGLPPIVCRDGEEEVFRVEGYLTGIEVSISRSSL